MHSVANAQSLAWETAPPQVVAVSGGCNVPGRATRRLLPLPVAKYDDLYVRINGPKFSVLPARGIVGSAIAHIVTQTERKYDGAQTNI